jgi:hypothetical protein
MSFGSSACRLRARWHRRTFSATRDRFSHCRQRQRVIKLLIIVVSEMWHFGGIRVDRWSRGDQASPEMSAEPTIGISRGYVLIIGWVAPPAGGALLEIGRCCGTGRLCRSKPAAAK